MTFRKLSASSAGKLLRAYFTENTPDPRHDFRLEPGKQLDSGGRLTSYYTGRDSRGTWRPDLSDQAAAALGVDRLSMPKNDDLDRLFEAKRADSGEAWSKHKRDISAYDLTLTPHKSVALGIEFASSAAESAMLWHAVDRASDATMRYVGRELGWARKGKGGEEGAEPGEVAWVSFRHHTARPTLAVQDGPNGATYLAESPVIGDPLAHIHHALFNMVVTKDGRVGSLDTQRLHSRVHEFGGYFQARLADELRRLGVRIGYDANEQAVVLEAIPQSAVDTFSKRNRDILDSAKRYASQQGRDWDQLSAEAKLGILSMTGLASRLKKHGDKDEHAVWAEQADAIGWKHKTVLENAHVIALTDHDRFEQAYSFAARHLAKEFHTAAVIDHDKLRAYAVRGLIGTGITGGTTDIDRVVQLIEQRGIELRGERVALVVGLSGDRVRVTNTAQVRIEEQVAGLAKQAAADRSGALSPARIKAAIDASGLDFTSDPVHGRAQQAAIYALGQGGAVSLLTGVAGAGKTTLLQPLVAAWKADTRYEAGGREVVGIATGWKQADALKDAGIGKTVAIAPLLQSIEKGDFQASRNTVLVIDEISQVAPRAMLALLELQRRTGLTIKALGDREQAQSVEAGDAVEILRRALPRQDQAELLSTVRQTRKRDREVAALLRGVEPDLDQLPDLPMKGRGRKVSGARVADADAESRADALQEHHLAEVKRALAMKREDGTARFVGGDQDQVLDRIADFYMERRDALRAVGSTRGITVSTLTNQDAADVSRAIRGRLRERGELGADEKTYEAVDQRGEQYALPIATGDRVRLFKRTWAQIDGDGGAIGNNGDVVEVAGRWAGGLLLRDRNGRVGQVGWERLEDGKTGRLLLGFGHAMTVDAAQGITSDEHINALPRGSGGMTGFTAYVAESRARGATWTLISDEATFEAVRHRRALGDQTPVTAQDMWDKVAGDMASKPYKALGMDLLQAAREDQDKARRPDDLLVTLYGDDPGRTGALVRELLRWMVHHRGAPVPYVGTQVDMLNGLRKAADKLRSFVAGAAYREEETAQIADELDALLHAAPNTGVAESELLLHVLRLSAPACCSKADGGWKAYQRKGKWQAVAKASGSKAMADRLNEEATACYAACKSAHEDARSYAAGRVLHLLAAELRSVLARFDVTKRQAGLVDFDDLLIKARDLLARDATVCAALAGRHTAILVDEFQDTDRLQGEILWRLCAATPDPTVSWTEWTLRPGSLFLVGDPKQAIYRFRGADVASYVAVRDRLTAADVGARLVIGQNFRSYRPILEWVNEGFQELLAATGQPGFEPLFTAAAAPDGHVAVATLPVPVDGDGADSRRDAEAETVAAFCARVVGALTVRGKGGPRPCQPDDIALLAPTGTDLWRYERALEAAGISVSTQAGKGFFRRQEVQDLIALTRTLADARDTLALGALLRGPLVGLTEEELLDATDALPPREDGRASQLSLWTSIEHVGHVLLCETLAILQGLARAASDTTPFVLLCQAIEEMQVRPLLRRRREGTAERALANVDQFLEAARPYDLRGLQAFAQVMNEQWKDAQRSMEGRPDTEQQSVSLVTMHAAKGLEWPVVVPVNMGGELKAQVQAALDPEGRLHLPVFGLRGPGSAEALQAERDELERERHRIWYVAATRARDLLLLPDFSTGVPRNSWMERFGLRHAGLHPFDPAGLPPGQLNGREEHPNTQDRRKFETEAALIVSRAHRILRVTPHLAEVGDAEETDSGPLPSMSEDPADAATPARGSLARGLVLHKLLEEVLTGEVTEAEEELQARAAELATQLGNVPGAEELNANEAARTVLRGLALPEIVAVRARLVPECTVAASETTDEAEHVTLGVADAVVPETDGALSLVVDWKSDVDPAPETVAGYKTQVAAYLAATGARRGLIVFLSLGRLIGVGQALE